MTPVELRNMTWRERIVYAVISALVTIALLMLVAAIYRTFLSDPPVELVPLDASPQTPLCPGDRFDFRSQISVEEPAILIFYASVMNAGTDFNMPGTQSAPIYRTHPHPSAFIQTIPWLVPNLPPGDYVRVLAARSTDDDEKTLFLMAPFTVGADCKKENKHEGY